MSEEDTTTETETQVEPQSTIDNATTSSTEQDTQTQRIHKTTFGSSNSQHIENSSNPPSPSFSRSSSSTVTNKMAAGYQQQMEQPLEVINERMGELLETQDALLDSMAALDGFNFVASEETKFVVDTFLALPSYNKKLAEMDEKMKDVSAKMERLQKRVIKLQEKRAEDQQAKEDERRKEQEKERQLTAKVAKNLSNGN
eukprot:TRINITY_DN1866_c0_g1_i1.p2 TRINITY_DN1866_c0_g1~~TRINITY_DN1866_c0_g1_i1.p2  ORF type:complete len:199 (-),score=75.83 TRINITY_DN1866_c0_g1_i1:762-1358(-)